jgi:acetyl-CoA acetyltransferase
MSEVYVIGASCTAFGKQPQRSFHDLAREAWLAVLADAAEGVP